MATDQIEQEPATQSHGKSQRPLRLALIGCGAISQQMHMPVLAGHESIEVAVLVDRDRQRAQELGTGTASSPF